MPNDTVAELRGLTHVRVSLGGRPVGTLARSPQTGALLFEYDAGWLGTGFSISPFSLPLRRGVFEPGRDFPDGMFGVFRDSLPDDWGRLLQDRRLMELGMRPNELTALSRLALVGNTGLGALEYTPSLLQANRVPTSDFDTLSDACQHILDEQGTSQLDTLFALGSSSGGARPKVMVTLDGEAWIIKFPTREDGLESGALEYAYALAATSCGIRMPEVRLLPSRRCAGFFAVKRFDRKGLPGGDVEKTHMASAAALLEASPFDVVDYRDLMQLVLSLTEDISQTEQLFRVMCFNVLANNCDDHAKNFSFLCEEGEWQLAPAYDLTYDPGFYGEHAMLVNGKASRITKEDLLAVGASGGLSVRRCTAALDDVAAATSGLPVGRVSTSDAT